MTIKQSGIPIFSALLKLGEMYLSSYKYVWMWLMYPWLDGPSHECKMNSPVKNKC